MPSRLPRSSTWIAASLLPFGFCLAALAADQSKANLKFPSDWGVEQRATAALMERRSDYDKAEHQRLFTLSSRFETSEAQGYGKVTSDFDCAGLTMGAQQRIIADESLQGVFQMIEGKRLDALISAAMPTHGHKFRRLLLTEAVEERLRLVRGWQQPALKAGDCEGARTQRSVSFIADATALPADDPTSKRQYRPIEVELRALLITPDVIAAQKRESIGDALCARWIAAVWATRVKLGSAETSPAIEAANTAGRGKLTPCAGLPKSLDGLEQPNPRDTAVFYDMRLQPGLVGVMELQAAAMALPRVSPGGDRVEHTFYYATQAQRLDWNVPGSDGRFDPASMRSHSLDGRANGKFWQSRYQAKCYDEGQLRLSSLVFAKISGAKSPFLRTVANRKLTLLFGEGCVNGNTMDLRAMYAGMSDAPRVRSGCQLPSNIKSCRFN